MRTAPTTASCASETVACSRFPTRRAPSRRWAAPSRAALNDRGQVVGLAYDAQGGSRAFLLERGVLTPLDGPGAVYTRALDINNRGEITGDYGTRAPAGSAAAQKYIPPNCPPVTFSTWPWT